MTKISVNFRFFVWVLSAAALLLGSGSQQLFVSGLLATPPTSTSAMESAARRNFLESFGTAMMSAILIPTLPANAKGVAAESNSSSNPMERIIEAQDTLDKLLQNWQRATVDCTFADVPRELLEAKNKELLLEKAPTFALFDKSVSVETCKTT